MFLSDQLTPKQAAAVLRISPLTLIKWRRKKVGPAYVTRVGRIFYDPQDIKAWLEKRKTEG